MGSQPAERAEGSLSGLESSPAYNSERSARSGELDRGSHDEMGSENGAILSDRDGLQKLAKGVIVSKP